MNPQTLVIEDQTTPGTIRPKELYDIAIALSVQAHRDFNTSPWVEHGYCPPVIITLLPKGSPFPKSAWNLILLDELPKEVGEETLGFHDDGVNKIPYSEIGVREARESHTPLSEVLSHEAWEMVVDPYVDGDKPKVVSHYGREWIVEVADPVEGCGYPMPNGELVADFVWPRWFGMDQTRTALSQNKSVSSPFMLAPQGYISTRPIHMVGTESDWTQIFGERRTELPAWASRLPRIHGPSVRPKPARDREIWKAINKLEEKQMATQEEINALTGEVNQVASDITTVAQAIQNEIDDLATANPALDLSGLRAAIQPLGAAVEALGNLQPVKAEAPVATPPAETPPAEVPASPEVPTAVPPTGTETPTEPSPEAPVAEG